MHSFDPDIATAVGIPAAVIYQNIVWWCDKNAANDRNIRDGRAWSYNSVRAFTTLFPYLTAKQVRSALSTLEAEGLILVSSHNNDPRDRTKWYAIADRKNAPKPPESDEDTETEDEKAVSPEGNCICPTGQAHLPLRASPFAPEGKPLPDSKPVINADSKHPPPSPQGGQVEICSVRTSSNPKIAGDLHPACDSLEDEFEIIWKHYPRKVAKGGSRKAWVKARRRKTFEQIATPLGQFIRNSRGTDVTKIPHLSTWLNQERWDDDQTHARNRDFTSDDQLDALMAPQTSDQELDGLFHDGFQPRLISGGK